MAPTETPTVMSAARIHRMGDPDAIVIDSVAVPAPGPGEILVAVRSAAVNFPDTLMIAGKYQVQVPLPFVPGHEAAGVVHAVGPGVTAPVPGDRVAVLAPGAFAEYVVAPATAAVPIPDTVGFDEAAATWVCHLTAYHALRSTAELASGEKVLVLGAGGGVGLAAVELATILGGRAVAAASSADKLEAARSRGAEFTVDYSATDLRTGVREAIGSGSVDIVIDPVGGTLSEQALREMRWGGRFVTLGYASGHIPQIPLNLVLLKGVDIRGLEIRTFASRAPGRAERDRAEFTDLWASGRIRPVIGARYPLDQVSAALNTVAAGRSLGKTVIEMAPSPHTEDC